MLHRTILTLYVSFALFGCTTYRIGTKLHEYNYAVARAEDVAPSEACRDALLVEGRALIEINEATKTPGTMPLQNRALKSASDGVRKDCAKWLKMLPTPREVASSASSNRQSPSPPRPAQSASR